MSGAYAPQPSPSKTSHGPGAIAAAAHAAQDDHGAHEHPLATWGAALPQASRVEAAERRAGTGRGEAGVRWIAVLLVIVLGALFGGTSRWGLPPLLGYGAWPAWVGPLGPLALVILAHIARVVLLPAPGTAFVLSGEERHGG